MSTLNPESASFDFVPPAARASPQQHSSPTLHDNSSHQSNDSHAAQHAQYNHYAGVNGTPIAASKIPRSSSSHNVDPSSSSSHKFAAPTASSGSVSQEHSRERTTSSNASNRGRGSSSSQRGRGTSTRGRGGSRTGHGTSEDGHTRGHTKSASTSGIPVKKAGGAASSSPPAPKPQPPVSLDSVDEFPALGGGAPSGSGSATSPSIPTSASFSTWSGPSLASIARRASEQDPKIAESSRGSTAQSTAADSEHSSATSHSPTLSKSTTLPNLAASEGKKALSFARVVAPAPPPTSSASTAAPSSSTSPNTQTSPTMSSHTPRSASASSASVSANSTPASSIHSTNPANAAAANVVAQPATESESASRMVKASSAQSSSNALGSSSANGEQAESAGMKKQTSKNGDASAAAGAGNGTKKKKKRSSKDQQNANGPQGDGQDGHHGQQQQQPPYPYYDNQAYGNGYDQRDPFDVVHPDHTERPYFEPNGGAEGQWQQQPQQPQGQGQEGGPAAPNTGLTPLQLAFLAANGLSVEGMPNVPDDVNVPNAEAMQSYYDYQQQQQQQLADRPQKTAGGGAKKDGQKKGGHKRDQSRGQPGHPFGGGPQHHQAGANGAQQGFQSAQYPGQQYQYSEFDPGYYHEQQQQQQSQRRPSNAATEEGEQQHPPHLSPTSAFHFSAAAPTFTPHFLNTRAKTFIPTSPVLNSDAPVFEPHASEPSDSSESVDQPEQTRAVVDQDISRLEGNQTEKTKEPESQAEETPRPATETLPRADEDEAKAEAETAGEAASAQAQPDQHQTDEDANEQQSVQEKEQAVEAEQPQSPPHSTFSLLPPVTVDDVLDKAKSMAETVVETAQDAAESVVESAKDATAAASEKLEEVSNLVATDGSDAAEKEDANDEDTAHEETKANLDELAIPSDDDLAQAAQESEAAPSEELPTSQDAIANLDELDLPQPKDFASRDNDQRLHSKESTGSTLSEATTTRDFSIHSLSPSEIEDNLANANASLAGDKDLANEMADSASDAAVSKPPFDIVSTSDLRCTPSSPSKDAGVSNAEAQSDSIDNFSGSASVPAPKSPFASVPFEIVSTSDDQCIIVSEDASSQASTTDNVLNRFVRSSAPSPPSVSGEVEATNKPAKAPLTISTPPVVISPSTPVSPTTPGLAMFMNSQPTSNSFLQSTSSTQAPQLVRHASEAEKQEAIRLVHELRSEPNTPMVESDGFADDYTSASQANGGASADPDSDTPADFKFDLSGRFSELNSSKRKRGKADDEDDNDDNDNKERKDEKNDQNNEAPSLTMAIFSGGLLPRKQLIVSIFASLGINLILPFVNGVMLGFGEIIARDWLGPLVGLVSRNRSTEASSTNQTFSSSGLGLRNAGPSKRGGAQDVPGHAAAKTAVETVTEKAVEGASTL